MSSGAGRPIERKLAAIFAADVAGYSRLISQDEVGMLRTLAARRELMDRLIAEYRGRIANTAGDSVLAEFPSVVDAVQCAVEIQQALAEANEGVSEDRRMSFRIGIHVGDVVVQGSDLLGDGVNVAARLQTLAEPGGVCISGEAHQYARKVLPLAYKDLGGQSFKNIEEPIRAYRVASLGEISRAEPIGRKLTLPDKPSIAVLPFANMSGDPDQEYFADGMVEEITTALSRFRQLFVIARNSSFTYKGRAVDVKQVGRELGVRYLLEGSVRKSGRRLRITGQLIEASTGMHLWADRFEGELKDIFDLQDRVTEGVVGAIEPKLEQTEIERAKRKPTESLDAYDCYLRAVANYYPATPDEAAEMLRLLKRAIYLDSRFAAAYGIAAWCNVRRKTFGWFTDREQEIAETASFARRAVELARDDAVPLAWAALALAFVVAELDEATVVIDRALGLNPNLAVSWAISGWLRVWRGEPDIAVEHLARAMRLSPLGPMMGEAQNATAHAHFFAGRYDEACLWAARTTLESPNVPGGVRILAASNALAGHSESAKAAIVRLLQIDPMRRIANLKDVLGPYRRTEDITKYADGLRKAGLPKHDHS